ncbi:hypothetical protein HHI36_019314 [Cryptolaemus montrouzieri]|uniref:Uncharacterized protein n=1 Tax=Cryptolaemus montrouzieri TaxID=559131 RepID=A0ABD2P2V6_9CUCU
MQEETCEPIAVCQGTDNLEDGFVDPRSFCFNISANVENICRPKSCPIQKIGEKAETPDIDDDIFGKDTKTFLIPMKVPATQCVPWQARGPRDTDEPGSGRHPESGVTQSGAIAPSGQPGQIPEGSLSILGSRQLASAGGSKSAPPSIMSDGGAVQSGVQGSVPSGSLHSEREAAGLARLVGLDQGPASILASFGDVESAKESLASMGAVSMGGALVCECCKCEPCTCGPRGLNLQNLMAALKAMMGSGEDLKKLVGALGPGAFEAMETIRQKEGEATALWEAAEERVSETAALEGKLKILDSRKETPSEIALREAWMRGDFEEMKSCHCLPGMCPCPGGHYVLKQKKVKEPVKKEKKKIKKVRKKVKKIGKDGKEHETWEWATPSDSDKEGRLSGTCICPPTKHYLTPVSSETEISGPYYPTSKKIHWADLMVCTCPRLQRTLAILKPEVVKFKDVVKRAIKNYGMDILAFKYIVAGEIYSTFA